jgi:hypothetical protein
MNPQDALRILDAVCSQATMNRQQHVEVQQAVRILAETINPKSITAPEPKSITAPEPETIKFPDMGELRRGPE